MTYEEYSKLKDVPDLDVLFKQILDKDPMNEVIVLATEIALKTRWRRLTVS